MDYQQAMKERHMVHDYQTTPLPKDIVDALKSRIDEWNDKLGLSMLLSTEDESAFGMFTKGRSKGVRNFIVLAGADSDKLDENIGYASADLMLYAQTLGLRTWWIALTYNRGKIKKLVPNSRLVGIVTVGYGAEDGKAHESKTPEEVSTYDGDRPQWFSAGVEAALLAPTAMNKQGFKIEGKGNEVTLTYKGSMPEVDKGIVRFFFETGAGKDNFTWTDGWKA